MDIPYDRLSDEVLKKIIEEFVLREGTDYGEHEYSKDDKVEQVMKQLRRGEAVVTFDATDESCSIRKAR